MSEKQSSLTDFNKAAKFDALVDPPAGCPMFGGVWLTPDLEALKAAACARIDAAAEILRQTVLTPGAGQMAAYQAKETQARDFLCIYTHFFLDATIKNK